MEADKIIQEQIKNAPQEIKKILTDKSWLLVVNQISQTNNFSEEQRVALENEILFVLLGMELMSDFKRNIEENLSLQEQASQNISDEIYEKIFKDVEEFLPTEIEGEKSRTQEDIASQIPTETLPEIPPEDLPVVAPGETAHDVERKPTTDDQRPAVKSEPLKSQTLTYYPSGQDPYREPLE